MPEKEPVFVNHNSIAIMVYDEKKRTVRVFPWSDKPKKADAIYEVKGVFYNQFLQPKGPLSLKPSEVSEKPVVKPPKVKPPEVPENIKKEVPEVPENLKKEVPEVTKDPETTTESDSSGSSGDSQDDHKIKKAKVGKKKGE